MHDSKIKAPVAMGTPPCSIAELVESIDEFAELYKKRPIDDNQGGMRSPHLFVAWFMAKKLQPKWLIESGVLYGQGTWFFEQASPDTRIICIDPYLEQIRYRSKSAQYTSEDFSEINWGRHIDCRETLCFFDDHQNALERLAVASPQGFRHLMFEDNYPITQGDCVSLKTTLERGGHDATIARSYLETYYEFPPVVKGEKTRWGDEWTDELYPTYPPLIAEYREKYRDYFDEYANYTWICYAGVTSSG